MANSWGDAQILALGPRRAPYRVFTGILCVEVGTEPTAALAQGHTVAGSLAGLVRTTVVGSAGGLEPVGKLIAGPQNGSCTGVFEVLGAVSSGAGVWE